MQNTARTRQADLYLSMALARQYEDVGDLCNVVPAGSRAAIKIKRASIHYRIADDEALVDALIERFSREFVAEKALAGGYDSR